MRTLAGYFYALVIGLWVGGMSFFTFVVTPIIFRSYPRDAAGEIVGVLFPSYFFFTVVVSTSALVLCPFSMREGGRSRISLVLASLAVITALYVNFGLYPETREVKRQVHSFEAAAPDESARKQFRRLHGQSAILNLLMIADGLTLLVINAGMRK